MLSSPVLILAYNRADSYSDLLARVEEVDPPMIYVSCDGPANSKDLDEQQRIRKTSEHLIGIGKLEFRILPKKLGLKRAVEAGIDWAFETERAVIILEDDLLPTKDFFAFCEEGLLRFENVQEIQQLSGYNGLGRMARLAGKRSHFVSPVPQVWGWATWADRWHRYRSAEFQHHNGREVQSPEGIFKRRLAARWKEISRGYRESLLGDSGSWDYPWAYWGIQRGLGSIVPVVNLVENRGFDYRATHTKVGRRVRSFRLPTIAKFPRDTRLNFLVEQTIWLFEFAWWARRKFSRPIFRTIGSLAHMSGRCNKE